MQRRKKKEMWLELTSMTDMIFLLLIFFIVTTTFKKFETKLDVKVPKAKGVSALKKKDVVIEINKDGDIAFNGGVTNLKELERKLYNIYIKDPSQLIVIKADRLVQYERVVKVMGLCKSNNLENLGMAAEPENVVISE